MFIEVEEGNEKKVLLQPAQIELVGELAEQFV